jgi:hypothetical protein
MDRSVRGTLDVRKRAPSRIAKYVNERIRDDRAPGITPEALRDLTAFDRLLAFRHPPWYTECRAALQRLHDGTYGLCTRCHKGISPVRLDREPFARFCTRCEKILSLGAKDFSGRTDRKDPVVASSRGRALSSGE